MEKLLTSKLCWAIVAQIIGGITAFFQLQGWVVWPDKPFLKSIWWLYLTSLIIAPLFFWSTKWSYEHFGAFWNMRLAGFGISTIIFGLLAWKVIGLLSLHLSVCSFVRGGFLRTF